ncbi:MAG: hypothetical protein VXZ18_14255 [Pseudomonadota bacterium]|jgi:hypothetical protein|uniref:Uncharacterized protein n=1 Tax=Thalassococcus halodurans TaxID=373675 RepID=A0A1H6AUK7_9RHOB|nr:MULTISPECIES: hypothetical protein [Thalassococcus]MEC7670693.1 hypothetical protein [Pseudomonadota bacterium]MBO6867315.1 hypothetical protein [Thalassococcus sp.]MEC8581908.1 hypothetical protein [Pseudomonadota bacterium]SEG52294.1 hypothetical protein SAMN04488045_3192 [Thalassococcus halodurans]SEG52308.1 hypothetical protein SAMN04488045_3193 [Thalassococcus halodurans]
MKNLIALTAVSFAALTGVASADVAPATIASVERYTNEDVSALTDTQILSLAQIVTSEDSRSEIESRIDSLIRQYQ